MTSGSQQATKAAPKHTHNDRRLSECFYIQLLRQPIFSIGHSNVTSPQIMRLTKTYKMVIFEEPIPIKSKTHPSELVKPIISLARPEKDELDASVYIDHTCHNTPSDTTSGKYVIKIPRFDSGAPEEWIIFVDLVQKSLVGQNVTTGPSI